MGVILPHTWLNIKQYDVRTKYAVRRFVWSAPINELVILNDYELGQKHIRNK